MKHANKNTQTERIEKSIGIVMRVGVSIAAIIMIFGFIVLLVTDRSNFEGMSVVSIASIYDGICQLDPYAIMLLGIFVLILTPVLRVVSSIILFAKEKDKMYVVITSFVLIVLICSFCVGLINF